MQQDNWATAWDLHNRDLHSMLKHFTFTSVFFIACKHCNQLLLVYVCQPNILYNTTRIIMIGLFLIAKKALSVLFHGLRWVTQNKKNTVH